MHPLLAHLVACSFASSFVFCETPYQDCKDSWFHWFSPELAQCREDFDKCDYENFLQCLYEKLPEELADNIMRVCKKETNSPKKIDTDCVKKEIENYDK